MVVPPPNILPGKWSQRSRNRTHRLHQDSRITWFIKSGWSIQWEKREVRWTELMYLGQNNASRHSSTILFIQHLYALPLSLPCQSSLWTLSRVPVLRFEHRSAQVEGAAGHWKHLLCIEELQPQAPLTAAAACPSHCKLTIYSAKCLQMPAEDKRFLGQRQRPFL